MSRWWRSRQDDDLDLEAFASQTLEPFDMGDFDNLYEEDMAAMDDVYSGMCVCSAATLAQCTASYPATVACRR
jgi:hypothetical protein